MKRISFYLGTIVEVFHDRIFIFLTLANLLLLGLIWFFWTSKISPSGYQIYTQFYLSSPRLLETSFSNSKEITSLLPPIVASIIVFANLVLGIISRKREALASYLLVGSSLFVLALALVLVRHYLSLI